LQVTLSSFEKIVASGLKLLTGIVQFPASASASTNTSGGYQLMATSLLESEAGSSRDNFAGARWAVAGAFDDLRGGGHRILRNGGGRTGDY
jgi:hypothetical protein